ncbi:GCN5-related N-acetyltransferase [Chloroherpeton thalassium ATCC 35110]|uniref:GCN5-related N-acetyltransferase n=1 Tax=Chloroherpeton thalassium (strain ATCC 35110 / GB-78) TaxID=517418 RepID=B3QSG1_CHLT3|nr:GNAT family N-acetyltransferase [Chloroherpeton thalassium]ACF12552.1 GCN5-related N-acetyltransferase [Chloroherpeton thalassium ATCC 35110]
MKTDFEHIEIEPVTEQNFEVFFSQIVAFANYESLTPPDADAKARLKKYGFSEKPKYEAFLAYFDKQPVGFAMIFETFSSFLAKPTLYLEDIFVDEAFRGKRVGTAFFKFFAQLALERGCGRMEWQVLDWNKPAIEFYEKTGAKQTKEWLPYRLTEAELKHFLETM